MNKENFDILLNISCKILDIKEFVTEHPASKEKFDSYILNIWNIWDNKKLSNEYRYKQILIIYNKFNIEKDFY